MIKIEKLKSERVGHVTTEMYVSCPYCFERSDVTKLNPVYIDDGVKKYMCFYCKFSFKIVEV
jgi:hypothetical protein